MQRSSSLLRRMRVPAACQRVFSQEAASTAASASSVAPAAAAVAVAQPSSLWHKLLAFTAGLAAGGAYYVVTMQDSWRVDDSLGRSVEALRKETAKTSVEFRERCVPALEWLTSMILGHKHSAFLLLGKSIAGLAVPALHFFLTPCPASPHTATQPWGLYLPLFLKQNTEWRCWSMRWLA